MSEEQKKKPVYETKFRDLPRFGMFADPPGLTEEQKKKREYRSSRLSTSSIHGNPRFTVYTNIESDQSTNKGMINAPMDIITFGILKQRVMEVVRAEPGTSRYIVNKTREKKEDGSMGPIVELSQTWVGKDKNGMIWISVRAEGRPDIVFMFTLSYYHDIVKGNGEAFTAAEGSMYQAISYFDNLDKIFTMHYKEAADIPQEPYNKKPGNDKFKKPEKKDEFSDLDEIAF